MADRRLHRIVLLVAAIAVAGGCSSSHEQIEFTNASDTWLDVRFFVASPDTDVGLTMEEATRWDRGPRAFISDARHKVAPGATFEFPLSSNSNYAGQPSPLVHVLVEPVAPSWVPPPRQYWLELLTPPPLLLVASNDGDALRFETGGGTVALVPDEKIREGWFEHDFAAVPETSR